MNKKEIIDELKQTSKKLNKSLGRRDLSQSFNRKCINLFGSFNSAKLEANLPIIKRTCDPLPEKSLKLDKRLVRIVSHLTFDGHLCKDLKGFMFSSNNVDELEKLRKDVYSKFNIDIFKIEVGGGYGKKCKKYWYFNTNLCKFFHTIGTPKGSKVLIKFNIPDWIRKNREFSKEYLKIAFLCEGSWKENNRKNPRISFNINKEEPIAKNGVSFLKEIKDMLRKFDIETTPVGITKGNKRKDGKITKMLRFRVLTKENNKFIKEIGWYK